MVSVSKDNPEAHATMTDSKKQRFSLGYGVIRGTIVSMENILFLSAFAYADKSIYNLESHHVGAFYIAAIAPAVPIAISAGKRKLKELRRKDPGERQPA
ncbi:MAG: hypothetical protein KGI06_00305 [Candidatus Micrarchaeota archaeon]|nr:hypothetical protein [Candidatus Micrarchaeota archaeon]